MPRYQEFGNQVRLAVNKIRIRHNLSYVRDTDDLFIQKGWSPAKIEDLKKGWVRGDKTEGPEQLTHALLDLGGFDTREELTLFVESFRHPYAEEFIEKLSVHLSPFNVSRLGENPYLGLEAYTDDKWRRYAGREELAEKLVALLTRAGQERSLLFITGESGSGKSSFAQAGLVPALNRHYGNRGKKVNYHRVEPWGTPIAAFNRELRWLENSTDQTLPESAEYSSLPTLSPDQVGVLVIDQFEAYFRDIEQERGSGELEKFFSLLVELPPFHDVPLHIIATLRIDYLPALFRLHPPLYRIATRDMPQGLMPLGAMSPEDLKRAIQQPLAVVHPKSKKRFEAELLDRLASDTAQDAAYLPWLQSALWNLWEAGTLTHETYRELGELNGAISAEAESVLSRTKEGAARSSEDMSTIMAMLIDLIDIDRSNEEHSRRFVCRRRPVEYIVKGDARRSNLLEELVNGRLLSKDWIPETDQEVVRIIHDSLVTGWKRLGQELRDYSEQLEQRDTFLRRLREWEEDKSDDLLLDPIHLAQAKQLHEQGDPALQPPNARQYLQRSIQQSEHRLRKQRVVTGVLGVLLVIALITMAFALRATINEQAQREIAQAALATTEATLHIVEQQAHLARSGELAALSRIVLERQEDPSGARPLLLARESVKAAQFVNPDATEVSISALDAALAAAPPWKMTLPHARHWGIIHAVAFSPAGERIASAGADSYVHIWDVHTGEQIHVLTEHRDEVRSVNWKPTGDQLVSASADKTARVWDAQRGGTAIAVLVHDTTVLHAAWSHNGKYIVTTTEDNEIYIWDAESQQRIYQLTGHTELVYSASWSPDDTQIVSASWDGTARVWNIGDNDPILYLTGHQGSVFSASFSSDGKYIVTSGGDHTAKIWDARTGDEIQTLSGHTGNVYYAAFSPDGSDIATVSHDMTLRIWDWTLGPNPKMRSLSGHEGAVFSADWSPGGHYIASSDHRGVIRIWDTETGKETGFLQGHQTWAMSAKWSPDGSKLLSTGADYTARIWAAEQGNQLLVLQGHTREVWAGDWHPDGENVVTGSDDGTLIIWDSISGEVKQQLSGQGWIRSVQYSPDGHMIAAGDQQGTIHIWDAYSYNEVKQVHFDYGSVTALEWSPDNQLIIAGFGCHPPQQMCPDQPGVILKVSNDEDVIVLQGHSGDIRDVTWSLHGDKVATGGTDGTVQIWEVDSGQPLHSLQNNAGEVRSVAWSPRDNLIAVAYHDGSARLWNASTGTELFSILGHIGPVNSIAWHPSGTYLATAAEDRTIRIWYANGGGGVIYPLAPQKGEVWYADFSQDGSKIVVAGSDRAAHIFDANSHSILAKLPGHNRDVFSAKFDPMGERVVTTSEEYWAYVWYISHPDPPLRLVGHEKPVRYATWSPDGRFIATTSDDQTARLWNAQTGQLLRTFRGHDSTVHQLAFNSSGSRIATASADRSLRVWDITSGGQLLRLDGHGDGVMTVAFSHDGNYIASGSRDKTIRVWDASTGIHLFSLQGHEDDILSVLWSENDRYIISAGMDRTVRIWDVETGSEVRQLQGHSHHVTYAGWSPNSQWIVTSSRDGTVRLWPGNANQLIEIATSSIQRSPPEFTLEERGRFGILE